MSDPVYTSKAKNIKLQSFLERDPKSLNDEKHIFPSIKIVGKSFSKIPMDELFAQMDESHERIKTAMRKRKGKVFIWGIHLGYKSAQGLFLLLMRYLMETVGVTLQEILEAALIIEQQKDKELKEKVQNFLDKPVE
jgi:hypothetical protein